MWWCVELIEYVKTKQIIHIDSAGGGVTIVLIVANNRRVLILNGVWEKFEREKRITMSHLSTSSQ
jgi:hypothetical protein